MSRSNQEEQINSIFEAILGLAQLDYSNKAIITDSGSQIDAIASGVNMLSERLEYLVNKLDERTELLMNSEKISQLGSWQLDLVSNRLTWSDEVYRIFGLQPQVFAATYEAFLDAVHPDDRAAVDAAYLDSVRDGKDGYEIEHRVQRNNGEIRYVFEKCHHESDASGNITRSVGFVQDITQRKQAEQAIQQSEIRLNTAQQIAKIGSWELDFDTGKIVWSDEMYNVFNCDPEIFTPHVDSLINLLPNECRETLNNWIAKSSLGIPQPSINYFIYNADGSIKYLQGQGEVIFNKEGKPIKANGTVQDITERKKAEEQLIQITNRLSLATRAGGVGIWDWDIINNKLSWDNQMYRLYGITAEAFSGAYDAWVHSLCPEDVIRGDNAIQAAIRGDKEFDIKFCIIWPDSSIHYIRGIAEVERDASGKAVRLIGTNWDITESKQAEENLLNSLKEVSDYKYALDESSIVAITDLKGIIKQINDNFCKISGYSREELIGQDHRIINSGNHPNEFIRDLWVTIANGKVWKGEIKNKAKNGTFYWVDTTIVPFLNDEGKPYQYLAIRKDITERIEKETELEKTLKIITDYKYALDKSNIVAIADQKGIIKQVNDNFCKISKYKKEELIGQNHRILNSGYHPKEFFRDLWVTIANGKVWKGEIKNKAKDGTFYWVDTTIVPFLNEQGKPYQYLSIRSDITQQKEQENEIKQFNRDLEKRVEEKTNELIKAESDFKKILDNLMEGAQIIDFDMRCIYVNDTFVKYAHYSREELLGYTPMEKYPGFEQTEIFKFYQKCINERIPLNFENEFTYPDGTKKWFDIKLNPIPEGFFMLVFDISGRKKAEEKLEQQNKELAVSNTELEQFAYVASHDLQEPLRMVTSFLNLLEKKMEGQLNETNKQYIHFAVDGAMRMKTLIQDLLLYSRVGTNKENFAATDLNEVLLYVTQLLKEAIKKKQALITVKPMPFIKANKTLISQLFVNLVSNALKYHGDKQPEIEVGCKEDADNYIFYVKDDGIGIDPRFFDKIFIIFQRLHNKDEYSGTGIGLAICKKIVEIHNGKIWVESEPGKGSTFYFSIPKHTTSR